ncbi:unnamed protein product [Allacma fusca]|uniref:Uncharacterized protein n=1 Tax=Allacma fusca TaxID=39272 RepID=A0A8J2LCM0_9HEXA|nr:unnamed protein product [Allacma fusca]
MGSKNSSSSSSSSSVKNSCMMSISSNPSITRKSKKSTTSSHDTNVSTFSGTGSSGKAAPKVYNVVLTETKSRLQLKSENVQNLTTIQSKTQ